MVCMLKTEIRKAFQNRGFYVALLVGSLLCLWDIVLNYKLSEELLITRNVTMTLSNGMEWNTANQVDTSVYYNWLGVSSMDLNGIIFYFIFPILATMPYGWGALSERRNGYRNQLLIRAPRKSVIAGKYVATFLSGGVAVTVPVITDFLLSAMVMPATAPIVTDGVATIDETQFGSLLFFRHHILFVLADMGLIFLWGGVLSGLSLAAGQIIRRKIATVMFPFCLCIFVDLIFEIGILKTLVEWSPIRLFHMVTIRGTSGTVVLGEIFFCFLASVVIFGMGEMRDEGV